MFKLELDVSLTFMPPMEVGARNSPYAVIRAIIEKLEKSAADRERVPH